MHLPTLYTSFERATATKKLTKAITDNQKVIHYKGAIGSAISFIVASAFKKAKQPVVFIATDKEKAAYFLNDLEHILPKETILFYPGSYKRAYQIEQTDNANVLLRTETLSRIHTSKKPTLIVTYPDALFEKVIPQKQRSKNILDIAINDTISLDFLNEVLFEYQFKRVDFVSEPGEFSVRGGIVDVFSFSFDLPYRIEFFGDEVDSIRTFDIGSQLSLEQKDKIQIIPNIEDKSIQQEREHFFSYIQKNSIIYTTDIEGLLQKTQKLLERAKKTFSALDNQIKHTSPELLFCSKQEIQKALLDFIVIEFNPQPILKAETTIALKTLPQPSFNKEFGLLVANLKENHELGYTNYICCSNTQQAKRFHDIFEQMEQEIAPYQTIVLALQEGFICPDLKMVCYTDHQIFERYHRFHLKNGYAKKQAITLKELTNLEVGDYVTHMDHGIGKFAGLQKIKVEDKQQEAIKLIYGDRDILYVSIHSLHKISKYNGKDGKTPKMHKLGSGSWKALKQKTKTRIKKIAFNLIELYAKRKSEKGYSYAPDSYLQHELEASFIYEDTPDQQAATIAVKQDMEKERPMDRLVCGDVGFGKTEVAIRAAFKAVDNGKQVAVLVPTTILAFQHYKTFKERLKHFPVTVDYSNRFKTAKQKKQTLEDLASGSIDILIGTHQIANKNVHFKNLGLLIVDEEQKFGVSVKEKLKSLKENIDVLTLTATPIPRTLQFSLMAARDLSVINTPPPNRYPIESNVIRFSEETIRDAVSYEIARNGQVFFIHNRIENIKEVAGMLQRLVPDARIAIGHGQLDGKKLEELMLSFMNGDFDILVATTIIESGLDVPNANTIFINNANNFGLSDLHQMRGRVGRSNKKAFCYFITPPYVSMTEDARKRISALEQFSELGSGFNIAMKDLEIRGAGDILGAEQSGFIGDIGFDTYQKILQEAVVELKENEFKDLYTEEKEKPLEIDTQIDTDFQLLFPDTYINAISERLLLYKQLSTITNTEELKEYKSALIDRFGALPKPAIDLLNSVRIKWICSGIGIEKVVLKKEKFIGYFIANQDSAFYKSNTFTKMLQLVQQKPTLCKIKEKQTRSGLRLLLTFDGVTSIDQVLDVLQHFNQL